ncbi:hypothetical protein [Arthrobacter sp. OAP107]|uniref:hypothetical protein n=1 Tax=Arthrobacter sp. OAP107 TaxID=3156445 RepID=UPI003394B666
MKWREVWGAVLLGTAAPVAGCGLALESADRAAANQGLLLFVGVRASNLVYGLMILASFIAAAGLIFLIPAVIRRIPRKALRLGVGWTAGLAVAAAVPYLGIILIFAFLGAVGIGDDVRITAGDGSSVLISQDGFDGDRVIIYAQHDEYHYKRVRNAPEIAGWPRVKDQDCRLETGEATTLTCGGVALTVDQQTPGT